MKHQEPPESGHDVGSVGEEAAKLLGALQDWARDAGAAQAGAAEAAASSVAGGLRDLNQHLATGGEDCRYCPLCRAVSAVRGVSPEVRGHLANAASSLLQAVASAMATTVPDPAGGSRGGAAREQAGETPFEHIDLDDDSRPD